MAQVYLYTYGYWAEVVAMSEDFILAIDIDGVPVYVVRDGTEKVRKSE